jgi:hypothetical protein
MRLAIAVVMLVALACGPVNTGGPGGALSLAQLKFDVMDVAGKPAWCDPDFYPLARAGGEQQNAVAKYPEIRADITTYNAIAAHEHLPSGDLTDEQKLTVYRAWKLLTAVKLAQDGDHFTFDYTVTRDTGYERVAGRVALDGTVTIDSRSPGNRPNCPICLAATTLIATPGGAFRVTEVRVGTVVWTQNAGGERVASPVVAVGSTAAPAGHEMVHLVLADGRELLASPGHKTADGRALGSLKAGDPLDGSTVVTWGLVPYAGSRTYDLLPAGPTGRYWAGGILLSSTLTRHPTG